MNEDRNQVAPQVPVERAQPKANGQMVVARFVYFIASVIITFLVARIVLLLLAANQGNAFVDFVYAVGGWFALPFYGIFNYQPQYGQSVFELSSIVAIIVYGLIATGIVKLITLNAASADRTV